MKHSILPSAVAVLFSAGFASAQEFKGDFTLGYSAFTEESSFNHVFGEGAFEFGLSERASVQVDLGLHGFGVSNVEGANFVLHGIYDVHPQGSAGLFLGLEEIDGDSIDFYGLEYGQSFGSGGFEAYIARGEDAGVTGTVAGVAGSFAVTDSFGLGVKVDNVDFDGALDVTRFGVKGSYGLGQGSSVYAEVGSVRVDALGVSGSEGFVGLGVTIQMGEDRATFGGRGLMNLLPGG